MSRNSRQRRDAAPQRVQQNNAPQNVANPGSPLSFKQAKAGTREAQDVAEQMAHASDVLGLAFMCFVAMVWVASVGVVMIHRRSRRTP